MKVVVFSLGCKVNQYEGQSLIKELVSRGVDATDKLTYADCFVINTCSVTQEADKKSRQAVARVLKLNPNAKVIICGCSSQYDAKQYIDKPNVVAVSGTSGKMRLVDSIMSGIIRGEIVEKPPLEYEDDLYCELTNTRGFIKVQDGCDNFCSYCIIPYLRGRSRSRSLDSIIDEVKQMAKKTKEIVITGINVSDYGKNLGLTLVDLVSALNKIESVRYRFGSLECRVITDELLLEMKKGNWCDLFHLSMQSGSDIILKKMNRHYTSSEFIEKSDLIRKYYPSAGITTDVIVGFPTETEENFIETVNTCKRVKFSAIHVFPYSVRKGTVAGALPQVDKAIALDRASRLREVASILKSEFILSQSGKTEEVYFEEKEGEFTVGFTSNYIKVYSLKANPGEYKEVKLTVPYEDGIKGE